MNKSFFLSILLLCLVACAPEKSPRTGNEPLYLVTTTGMLGDAMARIAGEHARVEALMGPGVDPHLYKATPGDLSKLREADMIFYNGLHLEGKMGEVLEKLGETKPVVAAGSYLLEDQLRTTGAAGVHDPHIWFDVQLWSQAVAGIADALIREDSAHAATYLANKAAYLRELAALDSQVRAEIQSIPAAQRVLITAHDAFGYYGRAYGIEVHGLQGISTVAEFGLRDVADLVSLITERNVKSVFIETSISSKSLEAVVSGCKEKGFSVRIGGTLYSDAMGTPGTPAASYIGMVRANTQTIVSGLK